VWPVALLASSVVALPKRSGPLYIPPWLQHLALYVWFAIFVVQPHKEERFLVRRFVRITFVQNSGNCADLLLIFVRITFVRN
jgi:hypothetical protein